MSRSRRSPAPPSVPISEGRHPLLDPPPQGGGVKASHHAEGIASSGQQPPAPPLKCYLCSRSKVLPMFQVEQPKADEGAFHEDVIRARLLLSSGLTGQRRKIVSDA